MFGVIPINVRSVERCLACSYDLTHVPHAVCPECGADYEHAVSIWAFDQDEGMWMRSVVLCAFGVGGALFLDWMLFRIVTGLVAAGSLTWLAYALNRMHPASRRSYLVVNEWGYVVIPSRIYNKRDPYICIPMLPDTASNSRCSVEPVVMSWKKAVRSFAGSRSLLNEISRRLNVPEKLLAKLDVVHDTR